jgi:MFS family permease
VNTPVYDKGITALLMIDPYKKDLAASVEVTQWLVNAYTLCLSALLLVGGTAADRYGRPRFSSVGLRYLPRHRCGADFRRVLRN